jgi:hypothetical protein
VTREHSSPTSPTDKSAWLAGALPSIPAGTRVWSIVETLPPLSLTAEQRSHALTTGDVAVGIDVPFRWKRAREAGHPKRPRRPPSLARAIAEAEKAGKTVTTSTQNARRRHTDVRRIDRNRYRSRTCGLRGAPWQGVT